MEFSECMYLLKEICEHNTCSSCPIVTMCPDGCLVSIPDHAVEAIEMAAKAYKKNKPKYPTWEKWLLDMGVMQDMTEFLRMRPKKLFLDGVPIYLVPSEKILEPIPPDIAEKLGISPIADDSDG